MPDALAKPKNQILTSALVQPLASGFQGLLDAMPNPDEVLREEGRGIYRKMLNDPHIKATLRQRVTRMLGRPWDIRPFDESAFAVEVSDYTKDVLNSEVNFTSDLEHLASALPFGYAVSEAVWRIEDTPVLDSLKARREDRFGFRPNGTLLLEKPPPGRELGMNFKFIVHRNAEDAENPYGNSVLAPCLWPWRFKNAGFEFWLNILDRFGVPSLAALFEGGSDAEKNRELANLIVEQLMLMANGGAGAFANVKDVKPVSVSGKGEDFEKLIALCNNEISKAILTVVLVTDTDGKGSYALGQVQEDALEKNISEGDRRALAATVTRSIVRWIVELRFGARGLAVLPSFVFDEFQTAPWSVVREAMDREVPVSKSALYNVYNLPEPADEDDTFVGKPVSGMNPEALALGDDTDFFTWPTKRSRIRLT